MGRHWTDWYDPMDQLYKRVITMQPQEALPVEDCVFPKWPHLDNYLFLDVLLIVWPTKKSPLGSLSLNLGRSLELSQPMEHVRIDLRCLPRLGSKKGSFCLVSNFYLCLCLCLSLLPSLLPTLPPSLFFSKGWSPLEPSSQVVKKPRPLGEADMQRKWGFL